MAEAKDAAAHVNSRTTTEWIVGSYAAPYTDIRDVRAAVRKCKDEDRVVKVTQLVKSQDKVRAQFDVTQRTYQDLCDARTGGDAHDWSTHESKDDQGNVVKTPRCKHCGLKPGEVYV